MTDSAEFYSVTFPDRHIPEHREAQFHFYRNEIAIVAGAVNGRHEGTTIDEASARELHNVLGQWLERRP